jgi:hypothetical protein
MVSGHDCFSSALRGGEEVQDGFGIAQVPVERPLRSGRLRRQGSRGTVALQRAGGQLSNPPPRDDCDVIVLFTRRGQSPEGVTSAEGAGCRLTSSATSAQRRPPLGVRFRRSLGDGGTRSPLVVAGHPPTVASSPARSRTVPETSGAARSIPDLRRSNAFVGRSRVIPGRIVV